MGRSAEGLARRAEQHRQYRLRHPNRIRILTPEQKKRAQERKRAHRAMPEGKAQRAEEDRRRTERELGRKMAADDEVVALEHPIIDRAKAILRDMAIRPDNREVLNSGIYDDALGIAILRICERKPVKPAVTKFLRDTRQWLYITGPLILTGEDGQEQWT